MSSKNIILIVVILLIGAAVLLFTKPSVPSEEASEYPAGDILIEGTQTCLPHRDTSGPVTLECAFGLETGDGEFFALDLSNVETDAAMNFPSEEPIRVTGTFTPVQDLPGDDRIRIYAIEGVIEVESIESIGDGVGVEHVLPPGNVGFNVPTDFGLAVSEEQVLVESVIPPCSEGFDYCLYYNASDYEGTNFESAGVRITLRDDLVEESQCLSAMPEGYSNLELEFSDGGNYATAAFSPLSDAAAGHFSEGVLYRLFHAGSCYELETRIGAAQFANFPEGSIEEFTDADRSALESRLESIVRGMTIVADNEKVVFPSQ